MVPVRFRASSTRGQTNLFYHYGIPQPHPVQIRLHLYPKEFLMGLLEARPNYGKTMAIST